MEMSMRAIEDIGIGENVTPPLRPLAAVLHDAAIGTRCSACFTALPPQPFPPTAPENSRHVQTHTGATPLYCSLACSAADSALHFSSAEQRILSEFATSPPSTWQSSSELRLSLRLAHVFKNLPRLGGGNESSSRVNCLERMAGLMTNREKLIKKSVIATDNTEQVKRFITGSRIIAWAQGKNVGSGRFPFEEIVLCLVMTNAVEVRERNGFCIGIAVYDAAFSWINHSCSPNCCYWFLMGPADDRQMRLRIAPASEDGGNGGGLAMGGGISDRNGYGPGVVVRSVKAVSKGEEVTVAYLDLMQPKEMRQAELWFKFRFSCSCKRCSAVPTSYVDLALQAHRTDYPEHSPDQIEKLVQNFAAAISGYLVSKDAKSCCRVLESFLYGFLIDESVIPKEAKLPRRVKLHLFHHLSINACISLASAYKVRASELLALSLELEGHHKLEALNMQKTSCAYYLLVAGIFNHLYAFEPGIVAGAAKFWTDTAESLYNLVRNFLWDADFQQLDSVLMNLEFDCCRDVFTVEPSQKMQLDNCTAKISSKVWCFLATESNFLKYIQNPVDLSLLESPAAFEVSAADQMKVDLLLLIIHCFRHAGILTTIYHGLLIDTN